MVLDLLLIGLGITLEPFPVTGFILLLSVLLHGVSADPLARRYGPALTLAPSDPDLPQLAERRLIRHHRSA